MNDVWWLSDMSCASCSSCCSLSVAMANVSWYCGILKMYLHDENEVSRSKLSKVRSWTRQTKRQYHDTFAIATLSLVHDLTFESFDMETSFLVRRYIFKMSRSGLDVKVIGSRSREWKNVIYTKVTIYAPSWVVCLQSKCPVNCCRCSVSVQWGSETCWSVRDVVEVQSAEVRCVSRHRWRLWRWHAQ